MVTKRIRSEYMKRFKDPKWETYAHCYEDLVKYRLSRRLLEQAHNPWFWDEGGSDTESSGKSTPQHKRMMEPEQLQEQSEPEEAPEQAEQQTVKARNNEACDARETSHITEQVTEATEPEEKEEEKSRTVSRTAVGLHPQTDPRVQNNTKRKTHYSQKPSRPKAKHTLTKDNEESRHPFALYGSGERQADMASKRTHNVSAGGSTKEIHESALRAKTRREVEKRMKKMGKQRAKSTDQENLTKTKPFPDYNPWMTEYMRCFSARSQ